MCVCEFVWRRRGRMCGKEMHRLKEKERLWEWMKQRYKEMGGRHKVNDKEGD